MKYFLDTEFIEAGPYKPIQLISIGIVAEDGRTFYAISDEFNYLEASPWVRDNVLSVLEPFPRAKLSVIGKCIAEFVYDRQPDKPEFWGYFADYDWVVFCQIFGTMMDLPKWFPMFCMDIKQLCNDKGNPALPAQESVVHNALNDARWNKMAYEFLMGK